MASRTRGNSSDVQNHHVQRIHRKVVRGSTLSSLASGSSDFSLPQYDVGGVAPSPSFIIPSSSAVEKLPYPRTIGERISPVITSCCCECTCVPHSRDVQSALLASLPPLSSCSLQQESSVRGLCVLATVGTKESCPSHALVCRALIWPIKIGGSGSGAHPKLRFESCVQQAFLRLASKRPFFVHFLEL